MKAEVLIEEAISACRAGRPLARSTLLALLDFDPLSPEALSLRRAAHAEALRIAGQGFIWAALGVDNAPCPMSCRFCSLGEKWGLIKSPKTYAEPEILHIFQDYAQAGARYLALRTTEFFSIERLCELLRALKSLLPANCELILNTGEFDSAQAARIKAAGGSAVYHTLRLREGQDTAFQPETRLATMRAARAGGLRLSAMVEPIGPEHCNEEIADSFCTLLDEGAEISGLMARVPVAGTPLGDTAMLSPERVAQITAALRLAGGPRTPDICAHPTTDLTLSSGSNVAIVDMGAIPRDTAQADSAWRGYGCAEAQAALECAGWRFAR